MLAVTEHVHKALLSRCDAWHLRLDKLSFDRDGDAAAKLKALKAVRDCYATRSKEALVRICLSRGRLIEILKRQHGKRLICIELILESRLLVHLGRANVLENVGLYADRTTGLPLIPGTALKGLLSTWACWEANQEAGGTFRSRADFLRRRGTFSNRALAIFGDDSEGGSEHGGEVVFVGGFPASPPELGLDIVNPHHEPDGTTKKNLTPNAFLCVEPGGRWQFVCYVRPGVFDPEKLAETTEAWLAQALTQIGIGAKTASGYGRFRLMNESERAAEERAVREAKAAEQAAAEKTKQHAAAQARLSSDFPNEAVYKNALLRLADNPGHWSELQKQVEKLRKPENASWLERFRKDTTGRAYRKLRDQPWYPR